MGYIYQNTVEMYTTATEQWSWRVSMLTARAAHCAAVLNDMIYVFGGQSGPTVVATAEFYNPVTDSWWPIVSLPGPRSGPRALVQLFMRAKSTLSEELATLEMPSIRWSSITRCPTAGAFRTQLSHLRVLCGLHHSTMIQTKVNHKLSNNGIWFNHDHVCVQGAPVVHLAGLNHQLVQGVL